MASHAFAALADPGFRPANAMAVSAGALDSSGVAWVHDELRRSLEGAHKLLRRHLRETDAHAGSDVSARELGGLRQALSLIHQAAGALSMVGSPAAARVLEASDVALRWALQRPSRVDAKLVENIEQASFAVIDWLSRLKAGRPVSALQLFPQMRALLETAGAERVHPADLWSRSWQFRSLPIEPGVQLRPVDPRSLTAIEQLTLANIKTPSPLILARISDFYAGAAAASGPSSSEIQAVWQLAAAVFEALARGLLVEDVFSKRLGSRLLSLMRSVQRGQGSSDEATGRLAHDLLFFCAQARPTNNAVPAARLQTVRAAYGLDGELSVDYLSSPLGRFDPALAAQARKRVQTAKLVWSAVVAGEVLHLGGLVESFSLLADSLQRLFADGAELAEQLESIAVRCAADGAAHEVGVAMEVATALLYLEAVLEEVDSARPGPDRPFELLARRIDAARASGSAQPVESWIEDLYGRVAERQTQGTIVQELRASMNAAEQHLDRFFRDPSQLDALLSVPGLLQSMHGVLLVLGVDQAAQTLQQLRREVEAFVGDQQALPAPERLERMAANFGMLGFLFDMLVVQPALARTMFRFDAATGRLQTKSAKPAEPQASTATQMAEPAGSESFMATGPGAAALPAEADAASAEVTAPAQAPARAPQPESAADIDPELQSIFSGEAADLLVTVRRRLGEWKIGSEEPGSMEELRRIFHNLKGSARMVGRNDVSELAWEAEQRYDVRRMREDSGSADDQAVAAGAQDDVRLREWTGWTADRIAALLGLPAAAAGDAVAARAAEAGSEAFDLTLPLAPGADALGGPDDLQDVEITIPGELDFDLSWVGAAGGPIAAADVAPEATADSEAFWLDDEPLQAAPVGNQRPAGFPADLPSAEDLDLDFGHQPEPLAEQGAARWAGSLRRADESVHAAPPARVASEVGVEDIGRRFELPQPAMPDLSFITLDLSEPKPDSPTAGPAAACEDEFVEADRSGPAGFDPTAGAPVDAGWMPTLPTKASQPGSSDGQTLLGAQPVSAPSAGEPPGLAAAPAWQAPTGPEMPATLDEWLPASSPSSPIEAQAEPLPQPVWNEAPSLDQPFSDSAAPSLDGDSETTRPAPLEWHMAVAPASIDALPPADLPQPALEEAAIEPVFAEAPAPFEPAPSDVPPRFETPFFDAVPPGPAAAIEFVTQAPLGEPAALPTWESAPVQPLTQPAWNEAQQMVAPLFGETPIGNALAADATLPAVPWEAQAAPPPWMPQAAFNEMPADLVAAGDFGTPAEMPHEQAVTVEGWPREGAANDLPEPLIVDDIPAFRQVGPLSVPLALFNIFLNEADELSRQLCSEMADWAMQPQLAIPSTAFDRLHALTGSSTTVGYSELGELARELEEALLLEQQIAAAGASRDEGDALLFSDAAEEIRQLLHQFAAGFLKSPSSELQRRLAEFHQRSSQRLPPDQRMTGGSVESASGSASLELDWLADIRAVDHVVPELFPIFEEEANELLPRLAGALRDWAGQPGQPGSANEAMRQLHTLKGGARLAGAMRLGELAHRLETRLELLAAAPLAAQDTAVGSVLAGGDALQHAFEVLRERDARDDAAAKAGPLAVPEQSPSGATWPASPQVVAADSPGTVVQTIVDWSRFSQPVPAAALATSRLGQLTAQASIKVRASVLERMTNHAGEVNMSRARVEVEMGQVRAAIGELGDNIERLRHQLHDFELQAETQISSRSESARSAMQAFDALEIDRFTRLQELTRMIAESVNDVATVQRSLKRNVQRTEDELAAQTRLTRDLQSDLLRTRMVEFDTVAERLHRVVRQAATECGKLAELQIASGNIEVDRSVLDRLTPVLEHLLRNAVIHGIEAPEQRSRAGKPPGGQLQIHLHQHGNEVGIDVVDDGAGLDLARIRARADAMGQRPTDGRETEVIFSPGFSTADRLTEMAGRGVGLDVVRNELTALEGQIEVTSTPGQGCRFSMLLPLTTAMTQVLMLRCGELTVAVPATMVERVRRISESDLAAARADGFYLYGDLHLPMHWLGALLDHSADSSEPFGRNRPMVIIHSGKQRLALRVDETLGQQEAVIRNLGPQLSRVPGLVGMSMLASGSVALIYNPLTLAAEYGAAAGSAAMLRQPSLAARMAAPSGPLVLVVDDSLTVRRITQRLLLREGYRVALAKDGIEALEQIGHELPRVVLSDIEMPRMDGYELVGQLRSVPGTHALPVVMITSRIADRHRVHAESLGVARYLGKPYTEDELLSAVADCLNQPVPAA